MQPDIDIDSYAIDMEKGTVQATSKADAAASAPSTAPSTTLKKRLLSAWLVWAVGLAFFAVAWLGGHVPIVALTSQNILRVSPSSLLQYGRSNSTSASRCPQVAPMHPLLETASLFGMDTHLASDEFRNGTIRRLSRAIQIPTVAFDDMGPVGTDERWDVFDQFADFLRETFPRVHNTLALERVNTHGLLYTWAGSDVTLKPTVLMAHQDVVPVPESTRAQWKHEPFSGEFDGKAVWGRGALDCKNTLIASLEAVEALLSAEFTPRRTVVLSFGFDEEISGHHGAAHMAELLVKRYGKDGAALVMDEGAPILPVWGTHFAIPGVSEKGYVDIEIVVRTAGGHSSMPPEHTSAGIAAELVTKIEAAPYPAVLHDENPLLDFLWCGAEHAPEFVTGLQYLIPTRGGRGIIEAARRLVLPWLVSRVSHMAKFLMMTTRAVDVVDGGLKVNALPERTRVLINHRVNIGETSEAIREKLTEIVRRVADKHQLALHAFDDQEEAPGSISVHFEGRVLEPAPVSPTHLREDGDTPWGIVAGTTRAMYGDEVIVAPGIMTANTDTKFYWDLSQHIFRYFPGWDPEVLSIEGIHTVGERVSVLAHVRTVQWYARFLRNMDEAVMP